MNDKIKKKIARGKSSARIMALQALYQQDVSGELEDNDAGILSGKIADLYADNKELELPGKADQKLLQKLIEGTCKKKAELDNHIAGHLIGGWDLERLGATLRGILRLGVYEIKFSEAPIKVIIKEYINLTDEFVGEKEAKFVNGILDKIAHQIRNG